MKIPGKIYVIECSFPSQSTRLKKQTLNLFINSILLLSKCIKSPKKTHQIVKDVKLKKVHFYTFCNNFWKTIHSFTKAVLELEFEMIPCVYLLNVINNYHLDQKMQTADCHLILCKEMYSALVEK